MDNITLMTLRLAAGALANRVFDLESMAQEMMDAGYAKPAQSLSAAAEQYTAAERQLRALVEYVERNGETIVGVEI
jgi:hypothetical protein